jgi:hypothetical protein
MQAFTRVLLTGFVVLLAVGVLLFKYWQYVTNPWTRNGVRGFALRDRSTHFRGEHGAS